MVQDSISSKDSFLDSIDRYFGSNVGQSFSLKLNSRTTSAKNTGISYRKLNHWEKKGLIAKELKRAKKGWRKFTIIDLIWMRCAQELRDYGVSITKIVKLRAHLNNFLFQSNSDYPDLEFNVVKVLCGEHILFLIDKDGKYDFHNLDTFNFMISEDFEKTSSNFLINLNNAVKLVKSRVDLDDIYRKVQKHS